MTERPGGSGTEDTGEGERAYRRSLERADILPLDAEGRRGVEKGDKRTRHL